VKAGGHSGERDWLAEKLPGRARHRQQRSWWEMVIQERLATGLTSRPQGINPTPQDPLSIEALYRRQGTVRAESNQLAASG
jgi:hypothetical protein